MTSHTGLWSSYALAGALATAVAVVNYKKPLLKQGTTSTVAPEENWREKYDKAQKEISMLQAQRAGDAARAREENWREQYEKAKKEILILQALRADDTAKARKLFDMDERLVDALLRVIMVVYPLNVDLGEWDHELEEFEEEHRPRTKHLCVLRVYVDTVLKYLECDDTRKEKLEGLIEKLQAVRAQVNEKLANFDKREIQAILREKDEYLKQQASQSPTKR